MWGFIKRLIQDDSGNAYVQYALLAPAIAIVIMGIYEALYGAPGAAFKDTIERMTFVYADGFENGVHAPGPYWGEVKPNMRQPSWLRSDLEESTINEAHTNDVERQDVHTDTTEQEDVTVQPGSWHSPVLSVPKLIDITLN